MKKAVLFFFSFLVLACNKADHSVDDVPIWGKFIGEINCQKNYKAFIVEDSVFLKVYKFLPSDTITIDGIRYNNVFFADIPNEIIKNSRFDRLTILDFYTIFGFYYLERGSITCSKYKNHLQKLRVKSIN
jgi:hypothetical protein